MGPAHFRTPLAGLAGACLVVILTACGSVPTQHDNGSWQPGDARSGEPTLPERLDTFLNEQPAGATVMLEHSPWGRDVHVMAHAPYHAASGRTCRSLSVETRRGTEPALVCQAGNGHWEEVRVLSHMGRAMPLQPAALSDHGPVRDITP
ncbi:DVU3141 family protein [Ectothiorhodospira sp. BSL-9]|uniref:DVU3141 family protein n=1 Tax=Ectothiorhodospira sp. BSL-9 TaxID=1442136 RepID=UPI0007B447D1|nr:DVU3141 family protein [Ectothiorhodospira sp. BSL-9]ANB02759.1 hypothetical protein ECTOBSL9_2228 [Ectothiorhodospira sp. BSL-9]